MQTEDQSGASQVITRNKAYSSRGTRAMLRFRGIRAVIPEPEISSATAATAALPVAVRSPKTGRPTAAATSLNEPSTSSGSGAGWPPAMTSSP